jgi:hypothetical protein
MYFRTQPEALVPLAASRLETEGGGRCDSASACAPFCDLQKLLGDSVIIPSHAPYAAQARRKGPARTLCPRLIRREDYDALAQVRRLDEVPDAHSN